MNFSTFAFLYVIGSLLLILLICIICLKIWRFHQKVEKLNRNGLDLLNNGQVDAAIATIKKAVALNPYSALSHSNLGLALCIREGALSEALNEYSTAIKIEPLNAEHYIRRAELYLHKMGDPISSKLDLTRAREIAPGHSTIKSVNYTVPMNNSEIQQDSGASDIVLKYSIDLQCKNHVQ